MNNFMTKKQIEIIYQDSDVIVINKPSGLSVTKDRSGSAEITESLNKQLNTSEKFLLVHRLDKATSGVMILARNSETQRRLSIDFEKRLVRKTYLAIVDGFVEEAGGQIALPLGHSKKKPEVMVVSSKKGKEAVTNWKMLADFGHLALLAIQPITGRGHQIRVHMKNAHMPLAIDPLYGGTRALVLSDFKTNYRLGKDKMETPLIERLTLHAYQLEVNLSSGKAECFIARLDKKFSATIKMLTRHNPKGLEAFVNPDDFDRIINGLKLDYPPLPRG